MPAPQMTTSAVGALMRGDMVARPARLSTLLDRLDGQLAGRAQGDRVDAVLTQARRHRLAVQRELARLADRIALGVELGKPDAGPLMTFGTGGLIQHDETGAPLGVTQEPDGGFEGLIALGERADLRVALLELALHRAARREDHSIGQIDTARRRGDEDQRPDESHGRSLDGTLTA